MQLKITMPLERDAPADPEPWQMDSMLWQRNRVVDFAAIIDRALQRVVTETATQAIAMIDYRNEWSYFAELDASSLRVVVHHPMPIGISMLYDLTGRTIDTRLLEEIHNEVTEWFIKVRTVTN